MAGYELPSPVWETVYFDKSRAAQAVSFFQNRLTHTKGPLAGKPFKLLPWQRKPIEDIFGTLDRKGGVRQFRQAYIEVPKKNGKTELAAGIALKGLFEGESGAEVYLAASTRDQAGLVFRAAHKMVVNNTLLSDACEVIKSSKTIYLRDEPDSFMKAISADAGTQDGINPSMVIFDELHRQKTRDLWDVLEFGTDARAQPLHVSITTAGVTDESPICWEQHEYARSLLEGIFHDASYYPVIYGLPQDADWADEGKPGVPTTAAEYRKTRKTWTSPPTGWYAANPSLEGNPGGFLPIERVRKAAEQAKRSPSKENSFRRLRLDQWVAQESRWIPLSEWDKGNAPFNPAELVGKPCYGGLDLSSTTDLTAFDLLFPPFDGGEDIFWLSWAWLPSEDLHQRSPSNLALWAKQGLLETTPGNVVDYAFIRKQINDLADVYDIQEIGHDPWNAVQIVNELTDDGFTCVPVRQGFASLSPPAKEFEKLVLGGRLRHGGNPLLRWQMDCTAVRQDPAGNIKPVKPDRRQSIKRIDSIVAAIMALDRLTRNEGVYEALTADSVIFG